MTINASNIRELHAKFDEAMKKFAEENGLTVSRTQFSYDAEGFKVKNLQFLTADANPDAIDPRYLNDLKRRGWQHGLTVDMIGRNVTLNCRQGRIPFKFVGMRASKLVLISSADNLPYIFNAEQVAPMVCKAV